MELSNKEIITINKQWKNEMETYRALSFCLKLAEIEEFPSEKKIKMIQKELSEAIDRIDILGPKMYQFTDEDVKTARKKLRYFRLMKTRGY